MKNPVKFGKYYLLERINVGGMAEVFKAKSFGEAGFERLVAVKRILPSVAEDQEFIAMFIDEAKIAVQLTHPNIAQIFELGKVGDSYFIALEYVSGKDLRAIFDRVRKRGESLPIPMACYVIMKVCEGLDYAHNKKDAAGRNLELVHRDVSPQNILVSYEGDVKIIDFGIAKAASKSTKTQAGILKGKFGYMSPEQVRGLQVDRRSDIFAIGICLYELLTMERLFVGESDFSTLEKVRNVDIMPPTTYNRKIPEELERIVLKALAKHPEDRYRTAMDLHDDLQSFMYTSGNFFARKDLSAFMHRYFADDIAKEAAKDEEYRKFDSRRASDLDVFNGVQAPAPVAVGRSAPPPPPAPPRTSVPPPPPAAAAHRPGARATIMGLGMTPPAAPPPPSAPSSLRATLLGPGAQAAPLSPPGPSRAATAAAPTPTQSAAPAPSAAPAIDMDWDDDELATQVYDRPDGPPPPGPSAPSRPPVVSNGQPPPSASKPVAGAPVMSPAQFAGPRAPTMPLPAATAPKSLPPIPAPPPGGSLPSNLTQPAVAPPAANGRLPGTMSQPAVAPPAMVQPAQGLMSQPAVPAPFPGAPFGVTAPPANVSAAYGAHRPDTSQPVATAAGMPNKRSPVFLAFVGAGALALLGGAALTYYKFFRPEPTGTLAISTNVPDVTLTVDDRPQAGNGMIFTVANLAAGQRHRIVARRPGYRPRELEVVVNPNEVTPVQIALEPEPNTAPGVTTPTPTVPSALPNTVAAMGGNTPNPQPVLPATGTQPTVPPGPTQPTPPVATPTPPSQPPSQPHGGRSSSQRRQHAGASNRIATPTPTTSSSSGSGGGGTGWLSISTQPAGRCTVAGQTFSTPRLRLELPAGTHRVTCSNPEFNVSATFTVTIRPGQETREVRRPLN